MESMGHPACRYCPAETNVRTAKAGKEAEGRWRQVLCHRRRQMRSRIPLFTDYKSGLLSTVQRSAYGACGESYWQIYIGDQCAACFTDEMENAMKLLAKLDALQLITPYGTGEKGKTTGEGKGRKP